MDVFASLKARGISDAGIVQVVLGEPITSAQDRLVLQRLDLPIARTSLRKSVLVPASGTPTSARYDFSQPGSIWVSRAKLNELGSPSGSVGPVPATPRGQVAALVAQIEGLQDQVEATVAQLNALLAQLRALIAAEPVPPGPGASPAQQQAYEKALAAWNAQVDALRARIAALEQRLARLASQMKQLQQALQAAQASTPRPKRPRR
jgi:chaperonin cofactor prefoldin